MNTSLERQALGTYHLKGDEKQLITCCFTLGSDESQSQYFAWNHAPALHLLGKERPAMWSEAFCLRKERTNTTRFRIRDLQF